MRFYAYSDAGIVRARVATWADGFGRWHAAIPDGIENPASLARRAIRRELLARGAVPGCRVRVVAALGRRNVFTEAM